MGHDIVPISNHNLDISNIQNLAKDISSRLDINIIYGYNASEEHNALLKNGLPEKFVLVGEHIKDNSFLTYTLYDNYYQTKQLVEKFGIDIISKGEYWGYSNGMMPGTEMIESEKSALQFFDYNLDYEENGETKYMYINNEHFTNHIPYISRWWMFCKYFLQENSFETIDLQEFRKELKFYTQKFGGNAIYYLDDQGTKIEGLGQGNECNLTWNQFQEQVKKYAENNLLDIPEYFLNEEYRNTFIKNRTYPDAFVDDFRDL